MNDGKEKKVVETPASVYIDHRRISAKRIGIIRETISLVVAFTNSAKMLQHSFVKVR
jgi:hypothetical protein